MDTVRSGGKKGRPRLYSSASDMEAKVEEYIRITEGKITEYINPKTGIPHIRKTPLYYGSLLLYLGFHSRQSAVPYEDGEYDDSDNRFSEVLARAKLRCECDIAEGAMMGDYSDRAALPVLGGIHGLVQRQEIANTHILQLPPPEEFDAMMDRLVAHRQARISAKAADSSAVDAQFEVIDGKS
jgi:hypothetical protein